MSESVLLNIESSKKSLVNVGSNYFIDYLRPPFLYYENLINELAIGKEIRQLDLCCGDGVHSFTAARHGAHVVALDYSDKSIEIAKIRSELLDLFVDFRVADVESLPFQDDSFDLITCVGSLSYLDIVPFFNEVFRVLRPGGSFIVLDSYNHNVFYRLNRFVHFIRGKRTYSTLVRMPNSKLIEELKPRFTKFEIRYFGIFIFLVPILNLFFNEKVVTVLQNRLDLFFSLFNKYSFKIVFRGIK